MGPSCIWGRVYAERLRGRLALDAGAGSDGAPRSARKASVHRLASSTSPRVIASFRAWFVAAMAGPRGLGGDASTVRSVLGAGSVIVPKSFLAVNGGGVRGVSRGGRTVESRWISLSARVNEGARFLLRPDGDGRFAPQTPHFVCGSGRVCVELVAGMRAIQGTCAQFDLPGGMGGRSRRRSLLG